ncbi:XDD4 family exosortase-dependent surface protein [Phormidesmis sp. 146-12]
MFKFSLASRASQSILVALGLFSVLGSAPAFAQVNSQTASTSSVLFSGTDSGRSASALFDLSNNVLSIALNNTSTADSLVPTDVLTGLFFDIGNNLKLNPISARLGNGSSIYGGSSNTTNVGGEWGFNSKLAIGSSSYNYGMSAAGLGLFGPKNRFDTSANLSGTENVGGLDYGIVTAGDNPTTGNGGLNRDLIKGSVVFSFGVSGLPAGFDLAKAISSVRFQYGTNTAEPSFAGSIPTPPVVTPPVVTPPIAPPVVEPPVVPPVVIPPVTEPPAVNPPVVEPPVVIPPVTEPPVIIPTPEPPAPNPTPDEEPATQTVPEPGAIAAILLAGAAMLRSRKSVRTND